MAAGTSETAYPGHPIFAAGRAFDAEALRRELAAGVDPDVKEYDWSTTLLHDAVVLDRLTCPPFSGARIRERLECIAVLLEAGASVDKLVYPGADCGGMRARGTLLWHAVGNRHAPPEYHAVIVTLLEAGADPNFDPFRPGVGYSVLANAAECGRAATVKTLISAGAVDLDRALEAAIIFYELQMRTGAAQRAGGLRICTLLLRAGAALPAAWTVRYAHAGRYATDDRRTACAYIERVRAAGGFKAYETAHRQRLVAIYAPKFPHLPTDMLGRVLEYSYNVGGY